MRAHWTIEATLDGKPIPGFPAALDLECSGVLTFTNRITSTAAYNDVVVGHIPLTAQTIRFILISPNAAGTFAVRDDPATVPLDIAANGLFGCFNLDETTTSGMPFLTFKATTNPTDLFVTIGFA